MVLPQYYTGEISSICFHKKYVGKGTKWHVFATAHGKGVCDARRKIIKMLDTKASLQTP
jgi:hypothetical protein